MKKKAVTNKKELKGRVFCVRENGSRGGMGYFFGFIGAAIYYISTAPGFWSGVGGVFKAMVWPALLVYELLKFLAV